MDCEFSVRERSREEDVELQRSTKKVKETEGSPGFGAPASYRDKLVGAIPGAFAQAFKLDTRVENFSDLIEEVGELSDGLLAVRLSTDTRKFIRSKWTHELIVKVFGRSVGFHYLHSKIMSLWKPAGRLDCIDLGKDFYLLKFGLVEDFDNVLKGGPWFIGGHYLTIRAWEPNFKPSLASCD